jgi:hypothetical protein
MSLASCGGGEPVPLDRSTPDAPTASAQNLAPMLAVRAGATAPSPGLHDCIDRLSPALLPAGIKPGADIGCLLGTYRGRTLRNEDCLLSIGVRNDQDNLIRSGNTIWVDFLRPGVPGTSALTIGRVDIDGGQIGLKFRTRPEGRASVTQSLVVTAAEHDRNVPGRLNDMTYERAEGGKLTVVHCRFHA